jgi:hypothetical protein
MRKNKDGGSRAGGEEDKGYALSAAASPPKPIQRYNPPARLKYRGFKQDPSCDFRLAYGTEMLLEGFGQTDVEAYDPWVSGIELVTAALASEQDKAAEADMTGAPPQAWR